MNRETRANLIVIAVVVAVLIPGAIIVVRRKMEPTARPMGRPDGPRAAMVYIDPTPAPSSVPRMMPALTASWTRALASTRLNELVDARGSNQDTPVVSQNRMAEVVGWARAPYGAVRAGVIVWNLPRGTKEARLSAKSSDSKATVERSEIVHLPPNVMNDLHYSGYPAPPQEILWAVILITGQTEQVSLQLSCDADGQILEDTIRFHP